MKINPINSPYTEYHKYHSTSSKCVRDVCGEEIGSVQASCYRKPEGILTKGTRSEGDLNRKKKNSNMLSILCVATWGYPYFSRCYFVMRANCGFSTIYPSTLNSLVQRPLR